MTVLTPDEKKQHVAVLRGLLPCAGMSQKELERLSDAVADKYRHIDTKRI
ncbi:MAG: hypothetical protein ABA06_00275 [Parcubacteria bacterium C7867-001]|nr:MAG: hypothetical protein ABA06_00275 [Parcubacteria bacterium C7867-001]